MGLFNLNNVRPKILSAFRIIDWLEIKLYILYFDPTIWSSKVGWVVLKLYFE